MNTTTLLILAAIVVLLLFVFLRPGKPRGKTDAQLLQSHRLAMKGGQYTSADRNRIEEEMRTRGLLNDGPILARPVADEPYLVQLAATRIRTAAQKAYEDVFLRARDQGKTEEVCHEVAVIQVLVSRIQNAVADVHVSEELIKMIAIESSPFNDLPLDEGKTAIIEYAVWREYPTLANENLISNAVQKYKSDLKRIFLQSLDGAPFPWVKFL